MSNSLRRFAKWAASQLGRHRWVAVVLGAVLSGSCTTTAPSSYDDGDIGFAVRLEPSVVPQGEPFVLKADIINRATWTATYVSGDSCPFGVKVTRKGIDITPLMSRPLGCLTAITEHPVSPGTTRTFPYPLTANAPPGEYDVTVSWSVQPFVLPLTAKLVVR